MIGHRVIGDPIVDYRSPDRRFLFEHERDVHLRLAGKPLAPAVDAVLADERQRVGQQIERHGEAPARRSHHHLVTFKRVVVFVEDAHLPLG